MVARKIVCERGSGNGEEGNAVIVAIEE